MNFHWRLLQNAKRNLKALYQHAQYSTSVPRGICWSCWDAVAQCESTQIWNRNSGNGFYGGLQFTIATWLAAGGGRYASRADLATRVQQITIASHLSLSNWPVCGSRY